jgi:3-polyprenyl-4-hydroxybenzoate decarboxylase
MGPQFWAAALALHLVWKSGRHVAWGFISVALLFMGVRRSVSLLQALASHAPAFDSVDKSLALLISFPMLASVWSIGKVFERLKRLQRMREDELERCKQAEASVRADEAQ